MPTRLSKRTNCTPPQWTMRRGPRDAGQLLPKRSACFLTPLSGRITAQSAGPSQLFAEVEDEVILRTNRVAARVQQHGSCSAGVDARSASDRQGSIRPIVVVWSLNGDLPIGKKRRPEAFPFGLAGGDGADALA